MNWHNMTDLIVKERMALEMSSRAHCASRAQVLVLL